MKRSKKIAKKIQKNGACGGPWDPISPPAWTPSGAPAPAQSLSPCCSIRAHLWQPFAERLLKACENLVVRRPVSSTSSAARMLARPPALET